MKTYNELVKQYEGEGLNAKAARFAAEHEAGRAIVCYGIIPFPNSQQEHYETGSGDAYLRAKQLRKLGFQVTVSALGPQVTNVGTVKMTMLTIQSNGLEIPAPSRIERISAATSLVP
jgi:hypothetical protein